MTFGSFRKHLFLLKTYVAIFLATFGKNWATFYSNIWSHCSRNTFWWRIAFKEPHKKFGAKYSEETEKMEI